MITQGVFYPLKNMVDLEAPELSYITPIKVKRKGKAFDIIYSGTPGNRQVLYTPAEGKFTFLIPFEEYIHPFIMNAGEPINIVYKL